MACVSAKGSAKAAPVPRAGQMAPSFDKLRMRQVGALVALVGRLAGPRSAPRPLPHEAVLLADAGLVLEPDLDGLAGREVSDVGLQRGRAVFLNSATIRSS